MGRRKIEIKAIKDDRNRSVTFLKRKGGLFKKAHELSVLCSVDVAVFIFGNNKKLYEYSSGDMRELITRYTYHGGPNEHKGPSDFNGGQDEEEEDDENGDVPLTEGMEPHMIPPQFAGHHPLPPHLRHHPPPGSPPMVNGVFSHPPQRGHTPQPSHMGSRPASRNDMRRMTPGMVPQPVVTSAAQQPPVNGFAYVPQPAIYNPQNQPGMPPHSMPQPAYSYAAPAPMQPYVDDQRRTSHPQSYPPQGPTPEQHIPRSQPSPPQAGPQQLPIHISPPPQPQQLPQQPLRQMSVETAPPPEVKPAPIEVKTEPTQQKPQMPLLNTNVSERKHQSIFTPIAEERSLLARHLAAMPAPKSEQNGNRSLSIDNGAVSRNPPNNSPPLPQRSNTILHPANRESISSIPETTFTPPSRSNSLRIGGARPDLKLQIPNEENSSNGSATAESSSPRNSNTDATSQTTRHASHSSGAVVLPPPSPSASALLSAGATGPPNPFARPISNNADKTPVSALPSRFLHGEFLPSPNSFYPEWNFRSTDSNTLPSPLNFATPVVGTGPSFLRDDASTNSGPMNGIKRKSPEASMTSDVSELNEAKRIKVD